MSLLEDVRRLADRVPVDVGGRGVCVFCLHDDRLEPPYDEGHTPTCPWLALPRIIVALEAAERVGVCVQERWQCPELAVAGDALVVALKGSEVTE